MPIPIQSKSVYKSNMNDDKSKRNDKTGHKIQPPSVQNASSKSIIQNDCLKSNLTRKLSASSKVIGQNALSKRVSATVKPTGQNALAKKMATTSKLTGQNTLTNRVSTTSKSVVPYNTTSPKKYVKPLKPTKNYDKMSPLEIIKDEVERAIADGKIFTVQGDFPDIARALIRRGWIEKIHHECYKLPFNKQLRELHFHSIYELSCLMKGRDLTEVCKRLIRHKLLIHNQVDFYWSWFHDWEAFRECQDTVKLTKISKIRINGFSFANKRGLCDANQKSYFLQNIHLSNLRHPRTYSLTKGADRNFVNDFNITAAMSLLKWVVHYSKGKNCQVVSFTGQIPLAAFDFAVNECNRFIEKAKRKFIDDNIVEKVYGYEWTSFLENFYKITHMDCHFKDNGKITLTEMVKKSNDILAKLAEVWPYLDMDGMMNIWILKPTYLKKGLGIHVCRSLEYILDVVKLNPNRRYVVQKYIERPLLIYYTKFDIRQWFLITCSFPLTIWMYKSCYLRFSSQLYTLRSLHESIHLTNNAIQCRYKKKCENNPLPSYHMWSCSEFKKYLSDIGHPTVFDEIIYPGMKECIIAAILLLEGTLNKRRNCFQLYGADFLLTEDFTPWLLEINDDITLNYTTPVTAKMCPLISEDVIKVVVDYENNKTKSTGDFELIYKETIGPNPYARPSGEVQNAQPMCYPFLYQIERLSSSAKRLCSVHTNSMVDIGATNCIKETGRRIKNILDDLVQLLNKKDQEALNDLENTTINEKDKKALNDMKNTTNNTCRSLVPSNYFKMGLPIIKQ